MGLPVRRTNMQADEVRYIKKQIMHFVYSCVTCYTVYKYNKSILLS